MSERRIANVLSEVSLKVLSGGPSAPPFSMSVRLSVCLSVCQMICFEPSAKVISDSIHVKIRFFFSMITPPKD